MRIVFFLFGSLEMNSGGFLYDRKLVEHLRSAGHQVDIVPLPWLDYYPSEAQLDSVWARVRQLDPDDYDLILQDELAHPVLCRLNPWLRQWGVPIASIVHHLRCSEEGAIADTCRAMFHEDIYLAGVDGFVLNSKATYVSIRNLTGSDRPFIIAPPGADRFEPRFDEESLKKKSFEPGPLRVLFAGNIIPRKGLHTLISGLRKVPHGDWRLSIAGGWEFDPQYAGEIKRRIRDNGLDSRIDVLGHVDDDVLEALLEQAHVLAVPSSYEGYGIIYAEAMGFGLPAIGCRVGGVPEIIQHGLNGFLIKPGDDAALARHLGALHADRKLLAEMGIAAHHFSLSLPTWEQSLHQAAGFLEKMACGS